MVTTNPAASTITPEPDDRFCSTSPSGVVASGSTTRPEAITCTTLGLTRVASASNDALSSLSDGRAGAVRAAWACAGCGAAVPTAAASTIGEAGGPPTGVGSAGHWRRSWPASVVVAPGRGLRSISSVKSSIVWRMCLTSSGSATPWRDFS